MTYRKRCFLRRFQHNSTTGRKCRRNFVRQQNLRDVPWNDTSNNTDWLPKCHINVALGVQTGFSFCFVSCFSPVLEERCSVDAIEKRRERATHDGRIEDSKLICRFQYQLCKLLQINTSLMRVESTPCGKSGLCSSNSLVCVFNSSLIDGGDLIVVVRRRDIEGLSIRRLDELKEIVSSAILIDNVL